MFLPGLLAMGGGGGIGNEADVPMGRIVAFVEKVIRSLAFSFISFTTFSFKIATSVWSSSICSICSRFRCFGDGLLAGV